VKARAGRIERVARNIYTTISKTDGWWEVAVEHRGLKPVLCDDLKGWDEQGGWEGGSGGRRHVYAYG